MRGCRILWPNLTRYSFLKKDPAMQKLVHLILAVALIVVSASNVEAGRRHRRCCVTTNCCAPAPSCCAPTQSCCSAAPSCSAPAPGSFGWPSVEITVENVRRDGDNVCADFVLKVAGDEKYRANNKCVRINVCEDIWSGGVAGVSVSAQVCVNATQICLNVTASFHGLSKDWHECRNY